MLSDFFAQPFTPSEIALIAVAVVVFAAWGRFG